MLRFGVVIEFSTKFFFLIFFKIFIIMTKPPSPRVTWYQSGQPLTPKTNPRYKIFRQGKLRKLKIEKFDENLDKASYTCNTKSDTTSSDVVVLEPKFCLAKSSFFTQTSAPKVIFAGSDLHADFQLEKVPLKESEYRLQGEF